MLKFRSATWPFLTTVDMVYTSFWCLLYVMHINMSVFHSVSTGGCMLGIKQLAAPWQCAQYIRGIQRTVNDETTSNYLNVEFYNKILPYTKLSYKKTQSKDNHISSLELHVIKICGVFSHNGSAKQVKQHQKAASSISVLLSFDYCLWKVLYTLPRFVSVLLSTTLKNMPVGWLARKIAPEHNWVCELFVTYPLWY